MKTVHLFMRLVGWPQKLEVNINYLASAIILSYAKSDQRKHIKTPAYVELDL